MLNREMARRLTRKAYPYAEELLSNEVYVFVSAIAMNALLSFFPFVLVLVSVATRYFPQLHVHTMTYEILRLYLPFDGENQEFIIRNIRLLAGSFGKVQILSIVVLIWSIANVFIPLEMALDRAWQVRQPRTIWKSQALAMAMVFISGTLAFLFIAGAAATAPSQIVLRFLVIKAWMLPLTLLMFFVTFYIVPNTKVSAREILPAAVVTGLLWELSLYVFTWIAPLLRLREIYGPFIVTVTLMTWAYVSGIILLLGANLVARKMFPLRGRDLLGLGLRRSAVPEVFAPPLGEQDPEAVDADRRSEGELHEHDGAHNDR